MNFCMRGDNERDGLPRWTLGASDMRARPHLPFRCLYGKRDSLTRIVRPPHCGPAAAPDDERDPPAQYPGVSSCADDLYSARIGRGQRRTK
jgi:hypothetical protein